MSDFPTMLSVAAARTHVVDFCAQRKPAREVLPLYAAVGRILCDDVIAAADLPPFANSAMDGFALHGVALPAADERRFRIIGTRLAGNAGGLSPGVGECVRITTGAPMPAGADTVVIREHVVEEAGSIIVRAGERRGAHVRPAGEDFRAGECVMRRGQRIRATRIGALAAMGLAQVAVFARPRVDILTTGDELVLPGAPCGPAQIPNSNGFSIAAMLDADGCVPAVGSGAGANLPFRHLPDDRALIRSALLAAAAEFDVIITSGGVSAGEADHLPGLIAELGRIHFWKVRMRPGMPILFGEIGKAMVFCLPGNPVSTIATFLCLVRPALATLQAAEEIDPPLRHARLTTAIDKRHDRTEFLRAACTAGEDGTLWVTPMQGQGSAMLRGMIDANALIVVAEACRRIEAGEPVQILLLPGVS